VGKNGGALQGGMMGFMDGFWFWLGKQCAEVMGVVFFSFLIGAYFVFIAFAERKKKKES
jgi:drug/metabolite transporter (DMT)-like permease